MLRTHNCGELREQDTGSSVTLAGWVASIRDHGRFVFINLRDRYGITQVRADEGTDAWQQARQLRMESVIQVHGTVLSRGKDSNPDMATGAIEVQARAIRVFSQTKTPPFVIKDTTDASEALRLKYRYLDLRRPVMRKKIEARVRFTSYIRRYFEDLDFLEIETPILLKSTPEGARDFLVPSRLRPGQFYALPQSPQTYKQILMVAGFDRYFQIARCFRDEDLRADRQPEFTQLDAEMSFVEPRDIMGIIERLFKGMWRDLLGVDLAGDFPVLTYDEAMHRFGKDAPDMRYGMELQDITDTVKPSAFGLFRNTIEAGNRVIAMNVAKGAGFSRKQVDTLVEFARSRGLGGLLWMKVGADGVTGPGTKHIEDPVKQAIIRSMQAEQGDLILAAAAPEMTALRAMGALREEVASRMGLDKAGEWRFVWITEFPMFEYNEEEDRPQAVHHPFTSVMPEDLHMLHSDPYKVRARAYDIVLNGVELGGGSIRNHDPDVQMQVFEVLGMNREQALQKFGFLVDALSFGAPPHGGVALGLDRIVMMALGAGSIRDVIAFPKTTAGLDLMSGSPSNVADRQLRELHLQVTKG